MLQSSSRTRFSSFHSTFSCFLFRFYFAEVCSTDDMLPPFLGRMVDTLDLHRLLLSPLTLRSPIYASPNNRVGTDHTIARLKNPVIQKYFSATNVTSIVARVLGCQAKTFLEYVLLLLL